MAFELKTKEEKNQKDVDQGEMLDLIKAREIVHEILNFGVNDQQIQRIIKLLSLELVNRDMMISIANALDGNQEVNKTKIEI